MLCSTLTLGAWLRSGLAVLALSSCSLVIAPEPLPKGFFGLETAVAEAPERTASLGVEVAVNEADSLESLDLQPGLRILELASGGPAERAGLRLGDVLLSLDGTPTDDPERLAALLRAVTEEREVVLEVQRGDQVLEARVPVVMTERETLRSLYFVERALWRVALEEGDELPFPRIYRLAPGSPLGKAGAREGDWILAFQGRDPGSPAELVRRVRRELQPGEPFRVLVKRGDNGRERELEGEAWEPRRRLNEIGLWPIFWWDVDRAENREVFEIGDLILISVFKMRRIGTVKRWSILSLFSWETGEATLQPVGSGV